MSRFRRVFRIVFLLMFVFGANAFLPVYRQPLLLICVLPAFLLPNLLAGFTDTAVPGLRLKCCNHGFECLLLFSASAVASTIIQLLLLWMGEQSLQLWLLSVLWAVVANALLFWNGIIFVYCTSSQLGLKHRIIGAVCGPIPILHLFALHSILKIVHAELHLEVEKILCNRARKHLQICKTQYPILLVHGVFFRDSQNFNYWGRVPKELTTNGAVLYYGEHQSALSVEQSAEELAARVRTIVAACGCEKLNIIAHSKGGLDCRYAIAHCGIAPYVASLTTINTPHRGCGFADYLLEKTPQNVREGLASTYNKAAAKLGDTSPDFLAAVQDLTTARCKEQIEPLILPEGIFAQSVGSVLKGAAGGQFPLNFSHPLVRWFDGDNDGLVSAQSFAWGERYRFLSPTGKRGISHGDMIDLNRENIDGFDVREFYVQLVSALRQQGL